jgi:hypothetical protein
MLHGAAASSRSIASVATRLGGEVIRPNQLLCPGPGHGPRDRSLSVWITPEGFRTYSFCGDRWQDCKDYIRRKLGEPAYQQRQTGKLDWQRMWHEARHPAGTAVETYLAARELSLGDAAGQVIRFHPRLWHDGKQVGAMLTLFRDIATNEPTGIIRTFLDSNGRPFVDDKGKTVRKVAGHVKGAAAKLDPAGACLVIGEGFARRCGSITAGVSPSERAS